jgi:hypothetical protein
MCITLSLLGNGSVKTLSRQQYTRNIRRIVGPVVFYAARFLIKESRRKSIGHVEFTVKNIVCFNIICKLIATLVLCTTKMYTKVTYIDTVFFGEKARC